MEAVMKVAVIGLGGIFKAHARALEQVEGLELVAVCDNRTDALANASLAQGVRAYTDARRMLEEVRPDIVAILTGNSSHAPLTMLSAEYRPKAIVCEKPMCEHYRDALKMVRACEERGVELVINHQRNLVQGERIRELIDEGTIGDVFSISIRIAGDFVSDGTHAVSMIEHLTGYPLPARILGSVSFDPSPEQQVRYGHSVEQAAHAFWMIDGRVRCEIGSGELSTRHGYMHMRIMGSCGEILVPGGMDQNVYLRNGKPGEHELRLDENRWYLMPAMVENGPWRKFPVQANGFVLTYRYILEKLNGARAVHPLNGRDCLKTQQILNAVFLSALRRQPVELPLPPDAGSVIEQLKPLKPLDH